MQDEESLVRRAQDGDQEAFARLYEDHFDRIYRYIVIRIGRETEAEDMTQQVFLNAFKALPSFKWKGAPFTSWLFRIAHNQVVDYLRKKAKQATVRLDESLATLVSKDAGPEAIAEHSLDVEQLFLATRRLTEAQREVISLRFTSEFSTAEIAAIMGRSQGAVKALQHSAIVALRKALMGNGDEKG